ncbi:MAG: cupin domain-containing protein [Leadbetterella sp.]|nr:cupin domain-containing protein [Leadbetterella sp.]
MQRRKFIASAAALASVAAAPEVFAGNNPKPFVVKAGEARFGVHTPFKGVNPNDLKISGKDTNGQLAVFEYTGHVKEGPVLHVHYDQDEIFIVVEGRYRFRVGEKEEVLEAGDTLFLPRKIPHTWIQLTDYGKLIFMVQPAGRMEEFFLRMNELKGPPSEEEFQKITMAHGMKNVGPALSLE